MTGRLILLRHGESTANAGDVFAGWEDVPLTRKGCHEAGHAGEHLAEDGLVPDVVHTSLLGRAINTAHLVLDAVGRREVPVRRNWLLNERHYGALQGLSKAQARNRFGAEQVELWRRSATIAPPDLGEAALRRQQSDHRYADLPEARAIRSESLEELRLRMLPYWRDQLLPELEAGRTVLVVSHGNAIRMLLCHVAGIEVEQAAEIEVPTSHPIHQDTALTFRSAVRG